VDSNGGEIKPGFSEVFDSMILSDFALLCAIPLRDGCDVLDVIGRRLRARSSE
jgi:hypothetical protein